MQVLIPLNTGKEYPMSFVSLPVDRQEDNDEKCGVFISVNILKWELVTGLGDGVYHSTIPGHTSEEDVLDLMDWEIHNLLNHINKYAPAGYRFDLPSAEEWICAYNSGVIEKREDPRYFELTDTWDREHCTPGNTAGNGVRYFVFKATQDGYSRCSDGLVYGKWMFEIGIRPVLRKVYSRPVDAHTGLLGLALKAFDTAYSAQRVPGVAEYTVPG